MMFLKQALAVVLAVSASSVEAKKTFGKKDFKNAIRSGNIDHKKLLAGAIPLDEASRRRVEDYQQQQQQQEGEYNYYDQEQGDWAEEQYGENQIDDEDYERMEVTSNYRLQFNSCLTLTTENYNLFLDNLIGYAKEGTLSSVRNYALLDICEGDSCYNQQTVMVDLLTFIESVIQYGPDRKDKICEACQQYGNEVCNANYQYQGQNDEGEEGEGENGNRRLGGYEVFDSSMCTSCDNNKCWYNDEQDADDLYDIEQWVLEVAQCKQTGYQWNGLNTFAGWMCNSDGSGIEIGVFIDQYCRLYNQQLGFSSVMQQDDYQYFFKSQNVVPYMFSDIIDCHDIDNTQFVDYDTYSQLGNNDGDDGDLGDQCNNLFNGEFVPRSMNNCGEGNDFDEQDMYQQAAEYNGGEYQQQDGGQNMYQYIQAQQMLYNTYGEGVDWYSYDLSAQNVLDGTATCEAVRSKWNNAGYYTGEGANGQDGGYDNAFNDEHTNDGWWHFNKNGQKSNNNEDQQYLFPTRNRNSQFQTANTKLSPFEILSLVVFTMAVTGLFMHYTRKQVLKRKAKKEEINKEVYVQTDPNGSPLIIS